MTTDRTPADLRLETLTKLARDEATAVLALLPGLFHAQWAKGRKPITGRPEPEDAGIRAKGTAPSDPTGDTATCPYRLQVRKGLSDADRHLLQAVARLRGTRAALERALAAWEGERPE